MRNLPYVPCPTGPLGNVIHQAPRTTALPSGAVAFDCDSCGFHIVD